jgi:hypothetical protein
MPHVVSPPQESRFRQFGRLVLKLLGFLSCFLWIGCVGYFCYKKIYDLDPLEPHNTVAQKSLYVFIGLVIMIPAIRALLRPWTTRKPQMKSRSLPVQEVDLDDIDNDTSVAN